MAASILLGSAAVGAGGRTLTATISGGTGTGYAITDKTGIAVFWSDAGTGRSFVFTVTSVSVSGTTLTVNLGSPVGTGEVIQLSILVTSNLTDSGANTVTGQSLLAVTNSSTVAVTLFRPVGAAASLDYNGSWGLQGVAPSQYINSGAGGLSFAIGGASGDCQLEFVADATDIVILGSPNLAVTAYLDDSPTLATLAVEPASLGGSGSLMPLSSSPMAAAPHAVRVNFQQFFFGIRLAGSTSTLKSVGSTKRLVAPATVGNPWIPNTTPVTTFGAYATPTSNGNFNVGQYQGATLDVNFTGTGLDVACTTNGFWAAQVDSGNPGLLDIPAAPVNGTNDYVHLVAGLTQSSHNAHVTFVANGGNQTISALRVVNGTVTTQAQAIGDSTMVVASTALLSVGDWCRIDQYAQKEVRRILSISGNTVTFTTPFAKTHAIAAQVVSYSAPAGSFATWSSADLSAKRVGGMGDSNTQGANEYGVNSVLDANGNQYSTYDARMGAPYLAALSLNYEFINLGIQGQTAANMAARSADIATYGHGGYDFLLVWAGTNEINSNTATPAAYQASIQSIVTTGLTSLRAGGKIILIPPGTPIGVTSANGLSLATCLTALQAVAAGNPTQVIAPTGIFNNITAPDMLGTLHFNTSGRQKIAVNLAPYLGGSAAQVIAASMFAAQ